MTPQEGQSIIAQSPASSTSEITERADIYFFRPLGLIVARLAMILRMTPIQVTITGAMVGVVGGALLYDERLGLLGFALLILHGIIDSADGQLARMTGHVTEIGRVLDGVSGYVTHIAIFLAIATGSIHRTGNSTAIVWMILAGVATVVHAQMYEYYRRTYVKVVDDGRIPHDDPAAVPGWLRWIYCGYLAAQHYLIGSHVRIEAKLANASVAGSVSEEDRLRYRRCFYWPARGWGFLGDNTRFYVIGLLACLHRIDLFFAFVLGPMNLALIAISFWQRKADRRFLASN